jgi:oligoendopeptidase F
MMPSTLPSWNLKDVLRHPTKDAQRIEQELESRISSFERQRSRLTPGFSHQGFQRLLKQLEDISERLNTLGAYGFLWFAENTKNQTARAFDNHVRNRLAQFYPRLLFFDLWWQSLTPKQASRFSSHATRHRYYLDTLTRLTRHTLRESEERIVTIKNTTGRQALEALYGVTTNSLSFPLKYQGHTKKLTREQLMSYVRHPLASVRREAYQSLFKVYGMQRDIVGDLYKHLVQDWGNEGLQLRHYSSPIAVRNMANDLPEPAVDALLTTCRKNVNVFQQYFRLKQRLLKLKTFHRYDLYAPYGGKTRRYTFSRAEGMVMDAYQSFSPDLAERASRVIRERHLDAVIRPGKMGGAFCYSIRPKQTPYVLVNFTGEARDVSTLAHELGHAVHAMLAEDHPVLTFHSALPLAETASIFGEQLLSDSLLTQEHDRTTKVSLLLSQLDDIYATIMRQAFFVLFEREAHRMIGHGTTIDDLAEVYLSFLREQFGKAIKVGEEFRWEWLAIPHIFGSPFYCYSYSFGNLLVLALFQQYKKEGDIFIPKYLNLLAGGGSDSPQALLTPLGVDVSSRKFWQGGFTRIQSLVNQLEQHLP